MEQPWAAALRKGPGAPGGQGKGSHCCRAVLLRANHPLLSTWEDTSGHRSSFRVPTIQERCQQTGDIPRNRDTRQPRRGGGNWVCSAWKKRSPRRSLMAICHYLKSGGDRNRMESDLSQRCTVKNKSREYSVQCSKGNFYRK